MSSLVLFAQIGGVQFSVTASPNTVFVRQQYSYDAALRINELSSPRFLAGPQYTAADFKEAVVYNLPFDTGRSVSTVTVGGGKFKQYMYHSAVFPLTPGIDTIPPSTLSFTLMNPADPYASDSTTMHSDPKHIVVLPLPTQGRPPDFSGAVGQFTLSMQADSQGLGSGTPFNLRLRVTGTGDVVSLQRPKLTIPWATVINTSDSVTLDSTGTLLHGFKEFRWLVTPQSGGHLTVPQVRYSYFNPSTKMYVTTVAAAIPLAIAGDSIKPPSHDSLAATEGPKHTVRWLLLLLGVVVLASAVAWGTVRRNRIHNP